MRVAVIYNQPAPSSYDSAGEQKAVLGVLEAVVAVHQALLELGHSTTTTPLAPPLEEAKKTLAGLQADLVFNLFEGFTGYPETEPDIPEFLSEIGLCYTGCPPDALRLALDKAETNVVLKKGGIDTPDSQMLNPATLSSFHLSFPCIVKPNWEDGSHGISEDSVVHDLPSLERQLSRMIRCYGGEEALVEEYIDGREFNVTVIGNSRTSVLAISEIVFSLPPEMPRILTYASKWEEESLYFKGTQVCCPAAISECERERISVAAEAAFRLTGCRSYARADLRLSDSGRLVVIEMNPNPDISPGTGTARHAGAAGMSYAQFVDKIVSLAMEAA